MTWLRDVLDDLADESPRADLAERTIMIHQRRRRTAVSIIAAAAVVITALAATATVRLLPAEPATDPGKVTDLPARGVGPLSHAYKTFCRPETGEAPADCRDGGWRVVTQDGQTYHVAQALSSLNAYRNVGLRDSPLAISGDGRKIAYYSAAHRTFAVRDLASGEERTAPTKISEAWLGSGAHLLLSDDGRFVAFTKDPALMDPAMLIDLHEGMVRPLPNGWNPIGLSGNGDTITLAEYAPKAKLKTLTRLWTTSTAGNGRTVDLPEGSFVGPLAPDGKTLIAFQSPATVKEPCRTDGELVSLDTETGKALRKIHLSGLPLENQRIALRGWLSATEITVIARPNRCRPAPDDTDPGPPEEELFDPPYETITAYAVNIRTGKARKIAAYSAQGFFELVLPGFPGTL